MRGLGKFVLSQFGCTIRMSERVLNRKAGGLTHALAEELQERLKPFRNASPLTVLRGILMSQIRPQEV
jgi:hypothetical protein